MTALVPLNDIKEMAEVAAKSKMFGFKSPDEAMAGDAIRAMAGPQAMANIQGPTQGQENLMSLLSTLRRPQSAMGGV